MGTLKIALLQLNPASDEMGNLEKGVAYCRAAKEYGADIALFPEMWNCGYSIPEDASKLREKATAANGPFVRAFANLAKELKMAICITYMESFLPSPRNSLCLFDKNGNCVLQYAKVHTCDFGDECRLTPGNDFAVATLATDVGPVCVGAMICYDREFPESARILMLKGAELILVPNACPMEINRLSQLRGRAYENMLAIVTCNYPAGKPDCNGHSSCFDGVAYHPDVEGSRDTCILEAGEGEGIYIAELNLDDLRAYRAEEVHGNAYRRPDKYSLLLDQKINEPFIRSDRRK